MDCRLFADQRPTFDGVGVHFYKRVWLRASRGYVRQNVDALEMPLVRNHVLANVATRKLPAAWKVGDRVAQLRHGGA